MFQIRISLEVHVEIGVSVQIAVFVCLLHWSVVGSRVWIGARRGPRPGPPSGSWRARPGEVDHFRFFADSIYRTGWKFRSDFAACRSVSGNGHAEWLRA